MDVKIRSNEDVSSESNPMQVLKYNQESGSEERNKLSQISPLMILDYIKSSVEILLSMKEDEIEFVKKDQSQQVKILRAKMKKIRAEREKLQPVT